MNNLAKVIALGGRRLNKALAMYYLFSEQGKSEVYIPLAYIKSTGTQHIDLGIKPSDDMEFEIEYQSLAARATKLFGCENTSKSLFDAYNVGKTGATIRVFAHGGANGGSPTEITTIAGQKTSLKLVIKNGTYSVYVNGELVATSPAVGVVPNLNIFLFASNRNGSADGYGSQIVYGCRVKKSGKQVGVFRPFLTNEGEAGLYNTVDRSFHPNLGTGEFEYQKAIPDDYIPLEYIESTGTQYINTGFTPNQDTRVVCDFQFTEPPSRQLIVFGARNGASLTDYQYVFGYNNGFRIDYNQSRKIVDGTFDAVGRHTVDMNKNVTTFDGVVTTQPYGEFSIGSRLLLFGINTAGSVYYKYKTRIYSCQIYDNNKLVRDYKPCISPDGIVGLYDLVDRKFYDNNGTGEFIAGYSIDNYIHDAANLFLDGIWNSGVGVHSDTLTKWVDLSGNCQPTPLGTGNTVGTNCIIGDGTTDGRMTIPDVEPINLTTFTLELIYQKAGVYSKNKPIIGRNHISSYYVNIVGESLVVWIGNEPNSVGINIDETAIHTLQVTCTGTTATAWVDGVKTAENYTVNAQKTSDKLLLFGSVSIPTCFDGSIFAVRLHNRILTDEELMQNYEIDRARFGLAETASVMMLGMPAETLSMDLDDNEEQIANEELGVTEDDTI